MTATAADLDQALPDPAALVTAIVVHYGAPEPTRRCLDSLCEFSSVILVDQPPQRFGTHPAITLRIEPEENIGFAAACNRAVAAAGTPFVLLLNNDAVLDAGAGARLLSALAALPADAAGACLKLMSPDGRTLQCAGGLLFTRDGIGFPRGFGETDLGQYDRLRQDEVGVPSGACALYRTEAWRAAGGMAEEFFCYCEDGDLGLRMIALGYGFVSLPEIRVLHELSSSTGAHSLFKAFHVERNHFAVMVHSAPLTAVLALPLWTLVRLAHVLADMAAGSGAGAGVRAQASAGGLAGTLLRAWFGALAMTSRAAARRRRLLAAETKACLRTGRFLATHRISFDRFLRSRSV